MTSFSTGSRVISLFIYGSGVWLKTTWLQIWPWVAMCKDQIVNFKLHTSHSQPSKYHWDEWEVRHYRLQTWFACEVVYTPLTGFFNRLKVINNLSKKKKKKTFLHCIFVVLQYKYLIISKLWEAKWLEGIVQLKNEVELNSASWCWDYRNASAWDSVWSMFVKTPVLLAASMVR